MYFGYWQRYESTKTKLNTFHGTMLSMTTMENRQANLRTKRTGQVIEVNEMKKIPWFDRFESEQPELKIITRNEKRVCSLDAYTRVVNHFNWSESEQSEISYLSIDFLLSFPFFLPFFVVLNIFFHHNWSITLTLYRINWFFFCWTDTHLPKQKERKNLSYLVFTHI